MLNAVKVLNDTEKDVIKQSLIGYNNREIGERLCRSGSRVQQIVSSVPYKIRNEIREIEEEARKK
jgi:DNA-directed RNA polymerase specialized sigma subunit